MVGGPDARHALSGLQPASRDEGPSEGGPGAASPHDREPDVRTGRRSWGVILLQFAVLAVFFAVGIARAGFAQSLHDLGLRRPALALFTLALVTPAFFELAYPWLHRHATGRAARAVDRVHRHAPYLGAIGAMMVVMRFENTFDLRITAWTGLDFTAGVYRIEGDAVEAFQRLLRGGDEASALRGLLDPLLVFVYLTVFALYHLVGILGFVAADDTRMVRRFTLTWVGIYAVALPFYLFVPVNEVWVTNPLYDANYGWTSTANVLGDGTGPGQDASLAIASINNCFPSLHNAFAWAMPFLLWRSGWRRTAVGVGVVASLITLSTLYLGIHWLTDMVAGIALAWLVVALAVRLEYRLDHRMRLRIVRWRPVPAAPAPA